MAYECGISVNPKWIDYSSRRKCISNSRRQLRHPCQTTRTPWSHVLVPTHQSVSNQHPDCCTRLKNTVAVWRLSTTVSKMDRCENGTAVGTIFSLFFFFFNLPCCCLRVTAIYLANVQSHPVASFTPKDVRINVFFFLVSGRIVCMTASGCVSSLVRRHRR